MGICAKGIIVYEVKNHTRIASLRFQWRETERISAHVSCNQVKFSVPLLYTPSVCHFDNFLPFGARIRLILYRHVRLEPSLKSRHDMNVDLWIANSY